MSKFDGKVGFVTAGATGIGFARAKAIVDGGGKVMICARREDSLAAAAEQLGANCSWTVCDVTDEAAVDGAVAKTVKDLGSLDLAVNAAGIGIVGAILSTPRAQFEACLTTNLTGAYICMRAEAAVMKDRGGGSIVNISSIAGVRTHPWMSAYCVSKAGLEMLTRCAADEWGEFHIRVNAVGPGVVDTPLANLLVTNAQAREEYLRLMPISRIGEPRDVANIVAFLLSDEASWMTGQVVGINGGHDLRQGPNLVTMFKGMGME